MDTIDLKSELRLKLFFDIEKEITKPEFWLDIIDSVTKLESLELVRMVPVSELF